MNTRLCEILSHMSNRKSKMPSLKKPRLRNIERLEDRQLMAADLSATGLNVGLSEYTEKALQVQTSLIESPAELSLDRDVLTETQPGDIFSGNLNPDNLDVNPSPDRLGDVVSGTVFGTPVVLPHNTPPTPVAANAPNDLYYGSLWGMEQIQADQAWSFHTGSAQTTVSVLDTGVDYTHRDLYQNIWLNQEEIPEDIRARLKDTDADDRITFWDLNYVNPITGIAANQGLGKITDLNGNGYIDGGDLLRDRSQGGWADGNDGGNGYTDDLVGWDFVDNDNNPLFDSTQPKFDHGTHVAGTIGAVGNNGRGVAGVNWKTQIMPVRIPLYDPDGKSFLQNAEEAILRKTVKKDAEALRYAVDNGARVSNLSWGGADSDYYFQPFEDAIDYARRHNHVVVASAGNDGKDTDTKPSYPASLDAENLISVASSMTNDALSAHTNWASNYGSTTVDLAAPGSQILSTVDDGYIYRITFPTIVDLQGGNYELTIHTGIDDHLGDPLNQDQDMTPGELQQDEFTYRFHVKTTIPTDDDLGDRPDYEGPATYAASTTIAPSSSDSDPFDDVLLPQTQGLYPGPAVTGVRVLRSDNGSVEGLMVRFNELDPSTFSAADVTLTGPLDATSSAPSTIPITGVNRVAQAYENKWGTSMAAPHVAGVAALVWDANPEWSYQQVIEQILHNVDTGSELGTGANLQGNVATGGRLNALKAIAPGAWISGSSVDTAVHWNGSVSLSRVTVSFNEAIDPTSFTPGDVTFNFSANAELRGNPSGPIQVTDVRPVADTENRTFEILFPTIHVEDGSLIGVGDYAMTIGPDIRDLAGYKLDLNRDGTDGHSTTDRYDVSFSLGWDLAGSLRNKLAQYLPQWVEPVDLDPFVVSIPFNESLVFDESILDTVVRTQVKDQQVLVPERPASILRRRGDLRPLARPRLTPSKEVTPTPSRADAVDLAMEDLAQSPDNVSDFGVSSDSLRSPFSF